MKRFTRRSLIPRPIPIPQNPHLLHIYTVLLLLLFGCKVSILCWKNCLAMPFLKKKIFFRSTDPNSFRHVTGNTHIFWPYIYLSYIQILVYISTTMGLSCNLKLNLIQTIPLCLFIRRAVLASIVCLLNRQNVTDSYLCVVDVR